MKCEAQGWLSTSLFSPLKRWSELIWIINGRAAGHPNKPKKYPSQAIYSANAHNNFITSRGWFMLLATCISRLFPRQKTQL